MTEEFEGTQEQEQKYGQAQEPVIYVESQEEFEELVAFRQTLNFGKPVLTVGLIVINVLVFLVQTILGGSEDTLTLIRLGAKFNPLLLAGDWWRFLTPMFLHIGFNHLAVNMISLYMFGTLTERIYGKWRFLTIYMLSGIFGTVASFALTDNLSAGASGALFGLVGAQLFFAAQRPRLFKRMFGPSLYVMVAINLAYGFMSAGIDNAGHIGGIIGGFLVAAALQMPSIRKPFQQVITAAVALVIMGAGVYFGYQQPFSKNDYRLSIAVAGEWTNQENYSQATRLLDQCIKWDGNLTDAYTLSGVIALKEKQVDMAKSKLMKAIAEDEKNDLAIFNLGCAYLMEEDFQNALSYIQQAIALNPNEQHYQEVLKEMQGGGSIE